jgi:hypothetical protein
MGGAKERISKEKVRIANKPPRIYLVAVVLSDKPNLRAVDS